MATEYTGGLEIRKAGGTEYVAHVGQRLDCVGTFWRDTRKGWQVRIHERYGSDGIRTIAASSRNDAIEMLMSIGNKA